MGVLRAAGRVVSPLVRLSYRDGETAEERLRKEILVPVMTALGMVQVALLVKNSVAGYTLYKHVTAGIILVWCLVVVGNIAMTKSLTSSKASVVAIGTAGAIALFLDLMSYGLFEYSTGGILGMDCMLLCNCSDRSTAILRNILAVYFVVMAFEQTVGLGIYDAIPEDWTGYDRPKSRGETQTVTLALVRLIVFLGDFFATRYFAKSMAEREASILASVDVAQRIAASLARFDLHEADALISNAEHLSFGFQGAFTTLVGNLRSYKPYLPQSCLPDEVESEDAIDESESTVGSLRSGRNVSSYSLSAPSHDATHAAPQMRYVVLMGANIAGFLPVVHTMLPVGVSQHIAGYVSIVVESVRAHRGLTESFSGDRILATFNAAKHCASAEKQAVDCAMQLKGAVQLPDEQRLVAAITGGSAMCGPMGSEGMMRYTILGHVSSWVFVMERYLTRTGLTCGVDSSVFGRVEPMYHLRLVDIVQFVKAADRTKIYEPTAPKELATEEWMYQLERSMNSWEIYNKVRAALVLGSPLSSEDLLALRKQATVPEVVALLRDVEAGGPRLVTTICDIGLSQASASSPPSTDSLSYESPQREHTSLLSRCSTLQSL